jgi:DNA-binding response OmpR family regulator/tRNA A-37 threonylcarbamoyl transferase component Bud32
MMGRLDSADLPQRFGPYVVLERIGDGGMAEIFLAKMTGYSGFEKSVALKKILPTYSQHPSFARMLIHEAKLAARIQHFNVVQVLDLGEIDGQVYIAMEYVRGRDLAALLSNTYRRKERLPLGVSLCVAIEFLTGLDYAHRLPGDDGAPLGLIHRDISPQNVLISFEGEVKLTDFGIARVIAGDSDVRLPGNLHGKFGYMSPEQVDGLRLDQRSDIFGAGVVLHEMLTGQRLFRGKTPQETVELVRLTDVRPPSATNPDVPHEIDRIVMKSLARDREQRYQTVGAMLGELSRATGALPIKASRRDVAVYMKRQFGASVMDASGRRAQITHVSSASGRVPIGQVLMHRLGAVTPDQIEIALAEQRANGGRLGEILMESGVISEEVLAQALALQSGLPLAPPGLLETATPSLDVMARFPATTARGSVILPISLEGNAAKLAVADPYDNHGLLEAKIILGVSEALVVLATRARIMEAIARWYGSASDDIPVEPPTEYQPRTSAPSLEPVHAPLVLIADADTKAAEHLAERVREEGYEVVLASNGKEARTLTRERFPTVAVLDVALPGIDGYNVLLDLRARELDCAVFMTSGRADEFQEAKALELGADDFLPKPWSMEVTTSKIRREMQKRASSGKQRPMPASSQFTGVSGSLADMSVLDIVQSLELGRKSAQVTINYEDGRGGELYVKRGELKGARTADKRSDEAFFELVPPGPGAFRIEYREPDGVDDITQPNTYLMLEALRRMDEADALRPDRPPQAPPRDAPSSIPPLAFFSEDLPSLSGTLSAPALAPPAPPRPDLARLVGDLGMDGPFGTPPASRMPVPGAVTPGRPGAPPYGVPAIATPARGVPAPAPSAPLMSPVPTLTPVPYVGPRSSAPPAFLPTPPPLVTPLPPPSPFATAGRPPRAHTPAPRAPLVPPSEAATEIAIPPMHAPMHPPEAAESARGKSTLARVALQRMPTTAATKASGPQAPGTPAPPRSPSEARRQDELPSATDHDTYPLEP